MNRLRTWLDEHLVDDWRDMKRWWSIRAAGAAGVAVTALGYVLDPNIVLTAVQLLYAMPPEYRWFVPPLIGFAIAGIPILLRLWKQHG